MPTGMCDVLDTLPRAEPLNAKDKLIHTQGLVSVLKRPHDERDAAVLAADGWHDQQTALTTHTQPEARAAAVETLLERLVALNARRAAEEAAGTVRWLRPDFQCKAAGGRAALEGLAEQIEAVAEVLAGSGRALSLADLEARFTARGRWRDRLPTILDTLEALGRARRVGPSADRWQAA